MIAAGVSDLSPLWLGVLAVAVRASLASSPAALRTGRPGSRHKLALAQEPITKKAAAGRPSAAARELSDAHPIADYQPEA